MDLQQFILKHIETVDHLRALLLLRTDAARAWTAADVTSQLYLQPKHATAVLSSLATSGLAEETGPEPSFRYCPRTEQLARQCDELATLDRERPVTLIKLIYSRPETLEAFADAFKLRRET